MISSSDFVDDKPWRDDSGALSEYAIDGQISGVRLFRLVAHGDDRGDLTVLLSNGIHDFEPVPHVYLVNAAPGSVRAWVYHKRQSDRLAFTNGAIRVVLYDLREDSPTRGGLNVIDVGAADPTLLEIPAYVAHGVQNRGADTAHFVNMPTRAYDPANPDKSRLPKNHPGIPYRFD